MITDSEHPSIEDIIHEIKKRIAIGGQTLINVMEEFEERCAERGYFLMEEDVKNFVKLMKFNVDNTILQVSETIKQMNSKGEKNSKEET